MASSIEEPAVLAPPRARRARWRRWWPLVVAGIVLGGVAWPAWRHFRLQRALFAARDQLRHYQPDQAADSLQAIVDRRPDCVEAEFLLAVAKRRGGRLAEAERHFVRAEQLGWDPKAIHRQRNLAIFQSGDYRRAGPFVKQLMAEGGSDDEAEEVYEAAIRGYFSAMLMREALFIIDAWCRWQPHNSRPYLFRAEAAIIVGDLQAEIAGYREYLAIVPDDYQMRQLLAEALLNFHKYDEALEVLRQCEAERPGDVPNLIGLGECLLRKGELAAAQQQLDAADRLPLVKGQRITVLMLLTKLAIASGDHGRAVELLSQVIKLSPTDMPSLYAIGQSLERVGRGKEAEKYIARWQRLKLISDRIQDLREELLRNPDSADLRCEMGTLLLKKDPLDFNGLNWLLTAVMRDPAHRDAHLAIAAYYKAVGDLEAAARHRTAAERTQPASLGPTDDEPPAAAEDVEAEGDDTGGDDTGGDDTGGDDTGGDDTGPANERKLQKVTNG